MNKAKKHTCTWGHIHTNISKQKEEEKPITFKFRSNLLGTNQIQKGVVVSSFIVRLYLKFLKCYYKTCLTPSLPGVLTSH